MWGQEGPVLSRILIICVPLPHHKLALLDGSNVVFKLLGPVLVKQDLGRLRPQWGRDWTISQLKCESLSHHPVMCLTPPE